MVGIGTGFLAGLVLGGAVAAGLSLIAPLRPAPAMVAAPKEPERPAVAAAATPAPVAARPDAAKPASGAAASVPPAPTAAPPAPVPPPTTAAPPEPAAPPPVPPAPVLRHAQDIALPSGGALVAVVLIEAEGGADFTDLRLPVTAALPPGASDRARAHAENGHEVAVRLDGPVDAAAALAAAAALPESTAVLAPDTPAAGIAEALIAQGVGLAAAPGPRGGVPRGAAPVFLTLPAGVTAGAVTAAFRRIEHETMPGYGIILVAPAEPAVLAGLLDWRMQTQGVTLAPLSALLLEPR